MKSDSVRRMLRTVVQGVLALAASAPLLVDASGVPQRTAGLGVFLAATAGITRVMALPVVDRLLPSWLRMAAEAPPPGGGR